MELTKEEREVLEFMLETSDHRYVNKNLEAAFGNGCLSEFRKFIIEHNKKVEKSEKLNALIVFLYSYPRFLNLSTKSFRNIRISTSPYLGMTFE